MQHLRKVLIVLLAIATCVAMVAAGYVIASAVSRDTRQAALEPFYTPPSPLPTEPGTVIRTEPLGVDVPHGTALRILYVSQRADGSPAASSGLLFLPDTPSPSGKNPIVAWAHGTVGMGDACAPSRSNNPLQDTANWLYTLLSYGVAVVATDYVGLGTPGPEEYLVAGQEARDVVNSVRAARNISSDIGTRWVVAGHSQGGHSALWTGHLAKEIAPELELLGVVAAAPAAELLEITSAQWDTGIGWVIGPEVSISWPLAYPGLPLDGVLTPVAQQNFQRLADECILDAALEGIVRARIGQRFFNGNPTENAQWRKVMEDQTPPPLPPDMPVLLEQGTADNVVLPEPNAKLQVEWCEAGSTISSAWLGGIDHMKIAVVAGPIMVPWVMDRFAGLPAPRDCTVPPPVPTTVPEQPSISN